MEFYTLNKGYLRNLLVSYTGESLSLQTMILSVTKLHHLVLELDLSAGLRVLFKRSVMAGYMNQG